MSQRDLSMDIIQLPFNFSATNFLLFSSFIFLLIITKLWKKTKRYQNLPPSPPTLPVIGHLHHLLGGLPHHALRRVTQKYGPVVHLRTGQVSVVVISSRQAAKEVLKNQDPACADRPQSIGLKIMWYNYTNIAFSPYNEYWRQMRKICILELLSAKNVRSFGSIRQDEASCLLRSLRSGEAVDLTAKINTFISSITCRATFGKVVRDREALLAMLKKAVVMAGGFDVADFFPSSNLLYALSWNRHKLLRMRRKVDAILDGILEEYKLKQSGDQLGSEDILDVLLRMQKNEELEFPITNDTIKAVIFDMFSAGTETSSTLLDWTMAELMRNPRVMAKAQADIREAFKGKKTIEESDIHALKYLKLVIKETLRLHPPSPLLLRACRDECKANGYSIPLKSKVLVNIWSMGRDPEYWPEPETFRPERFENSTVDFLGNHFEFIPFGSGKRICPGINFAFANVELPLALLLYHFDWEMPKGMKAPDDIDMTEVAGISALRKVHLFLVPIAYEPSTQN
ncbi:cytochrome p450 71d13 [Phtheirospermum japonicum]|uniref:Cytochrome p450 71d13 n=1 Tax=Phtheirospermum japonicum TaxID=374723 RepID=A0A830DDE9_9LAMI|nr:cytochrome p450 71d13 [Phtheirospermum japonicum]